MKTQARGNGKKIFRIVFLQCQVVKELPHMNMPLFVNDIKAMGCGCECICACRSKLPDLIKYLEKKDFDIFAADYTFPIGFLKELKALFPKSKFVIGGSGFLDVFLKTRIDFAVIGAGRRSFLRLVEALMNGTGIVHIPNLFFRIKKNNRSLIDYTGIDIEFDLKRELFPYAPALVWKYIGFSPRDRINDPPAIIAEFGCAHRSKKLGPNYSGLALRGLNRNKFTLRAYQRIKEQFSQRMRGGCTFCTCNSTHIFLPTKETVTCLMEQVRYLQTKYGFRSFVIGSENPFVFIEPLIERLMKERIKLDILAIRSRVDWVNQNKRRLHKIVDLAKKHGFVISLQQLGFESFIQSDLDIYNKGYLAEENYKAIELIKELREIAPENFQDGGHGFIGTSPWIKLAELKQYCRSGPETKFMSDLYHFGNGLVLYDSCLPIYQKLRKDGLLVENKADLDSWKFKDNKILPFVRAKRFQRRGEA